MALPGLRGTDHIGFTVPDLDEADRFFTGVLGCTRVYSLGPFVHEDDDWMTEHLGEEVVGLVEIRDGEADVVRAAQAGERHRSSSPPLARIGCNATSMWPSCSVRRL